MRLHLKESFSLFRKTFSFLWVKFLIYFLMGFVFLIFGAIALFFATKFTGIMTFIILLLGLFVFWVFVKVMGRYVLYLVKAGHIAVLGELVDGGALPSGQGMVSFGFEKVKTRFAESSSLFIVDRLIGAVVRGISNFMGRFARLIPIAVVQKIIQFISSVLSIFLSYIDEAILCYIFSRPAEESSWEGAKDGLVLYFKSWKTLLPVSVVLVIISYVLFLAVFGVSFLISLPFQAMISSAALKSLPFIISFLIAAVIKVAVFDQFTLVAVIVSYKNAVKELVPDEETSKKLEGLVPKFKEITSKAGASSNRSPKKNLSEENVSGLSKYIQDMRSRGHSDSQIKGACIDAGWSEDYVSEAFKRS